MSQARVIALGESAYVVAEFDAARAELALASEHDVRDIALEVGHDEAPAIQSWLQGRSSAELRSVVGPPTSVLYGSFLAQLQGRGWSSSAAWR